MASRSREVILPLYSAETPPGVLCPALEPSALSTREMWTCWSVSRGGPQNDLRAGAPLLRGQAETAGAVQPGEEKAAGRPYCSLSVHEGASKRAGEGLFTRACSDRTRGNGFKLKEGGFKLDLRKKFLL